MKVKELINELLKYDGDLEVIKSKDGEGNGFTKVYHIQPNSYNLNRNYLQGLEEL